LYRFRINGCLKTVQACLHISQSDLEMRLISGGSVARSFRTPSSCNRPFSVNFNY
jgi:hypothetical protein